VKIKWQISLRDLILIRNCMKRICQETPDDFRHDIIRVLSDIDEKIKESI